MFERTQRSYSHISCFLRSDEQESTRSVRSNSSRYHVNLFVVRAYHIEYQFPMSAPNPYGHAHDATQVVKISSKRFESNNDIVFSHLSTYPCSFDKSVFRNWWRSLLIFKIYSRMSGNSSPEQIGFAVLPLRNVFKANSLHFEQDLNVIDRTQMSSNQKVPNKVAKTCCIGQLHVMLELDSDQKEFKDELDRVQFNERTKTGKQRVSKSNRLTHADGYTPRSFISDEPTGDELVVQMYLSIAEARNLPQNTVGSKCRPTYLFRRNERALLIDNPTRNPYFICRAFWNEERITSAVCWGTSTPRFHFQQVRSVSLRIIDGTSLLFSDSLCC